MSSAFNEGRQEGGASLPKIFFVALLVGAVTYLISMYTFPTKTDVAALKNQDLALLAEKIRLEKAVGDLSNKTDHLNNKVNAFTTLPNQSYLKSIESSRTSTGYSVKATITALGQVRLLVVLQMIPLEIVKVAEIPPVITGQSPFLYEVGGRVVYIEYFLPIEAFKQGDTERTFVIDTAKQFSFSVRTMQVG